ncbi:MAG: sugar ABC transporter substrate-binding protein [Betaproteobacteria bacterium]|nr:sugar ABC transporter substrate-binding protein [Betaproteobacteria bacterium]
MSASVRRFRLLAAFAIILLTGLYAPPGRAEVTITYSDWQLAQDVWGRSLRTAIAEFEKENPDIKVRPDPVPLAQRDVKYTTAIRAGEGPDVFALDANPVRQYIAEGWVRDLSPFIQREGGSKFTSDFYPNTLLPVTVDKKIYGIPMNTVAMGLVYNKKLFDEAGIAAPPKTWDEFRAVAKKLTRSSTPGGPVDRWAFTVVMAPAGFDLRVSSIIRSFGGDFLTPDWQHSALNTPEVKAAFNYILDLIQVDKTIPPGVTQVDANGARRMLANQQIAMKIGTTWSFAEVSAMNPQLDGWNVLKIAPMPRQPGASKPVYTTLYQKSLFINKNSKNPDAAWKLVKFLTDGPRMQRWFDDNNMLSSRRSVNEGYDKIKSSASAALVAGEIQHGAFLPLIPQWPQVLDAFRQNLQAAAAGSKTRDQALADAHTQVEAILQRK